MKISQRTALALAALLLTACSLSELEGPTTGGTGAVRDGGGRTGGDGGGADFAGSDGGEGRDRGVGREIGPGDNGPGDEDADADSGPPIEETCATVCFEPFERVEVDPGAEPGDMVTEECNSGGIDSGVCPDDFSCGREVTMPAGLVMHTFPVCEPDSGSPHRLDVDFPAPTPPSDPVPVVFRFHLNGGSWPTADPGENAGLYGVARTDSRGSIVDGEIPVGPPGELVLELERGVHDAYFMLWGLGFDNSHYPSLFLFGTLVVRTEGAVDIWLDGTTLTFDVAVDGIPVGALAETESVTVSISGRHGQNATMWFTTGERPAGTVVLEPDIYRVEVTTSGSSTDPTVPSGKRVVVEALSVPEGSTRNERFNLESVLVNGTVRVDGSDLPAASYSGNVVLEGEGATVSIPVSASRPASFSGRVLPGTYDVYYDAPRTGYMAGVPAAKGLAREGYVTGPRLDLNLTTVAVSGEVTVDGAQLPDRTANRGYVWYQGANTGIQSFSLGSTGPGDYTGRVFSGGYSISVLGTGSPIPNAAWTVADLHTVTSTHRAFNINAATLTVRLTHSGSAPPDNPGGDYAGRGSLVAVGNPFPEVTTTPVREAFPNVGAMSASVVLPEGQWTLSYEHSYGNFDSIPFGNRELGTVSLYSDTTRNYDLPSVRVNGTITRGDATLPRASTGYNRGIIYFSGSGFGVSVEVPGFGDAEYDLLLYPGIYSLWYMCRSSDDCDTTIGPNTLTAYVNIELD